MDDLFPDDLDLNLDLPIPIPPAPYPAPPPPNNHNILRACDRCARLHVSCSRGSPCTRCVSALTPCKRSRSRSQSQPKSNRPSKRHKPLSSPAPPSTCADVIATIPTHRLGSHVDLVSEGVIILASPQITSWTGFAESELIGKPPSSLFAPTTSTSHSVSLPPELASISPNIHASHPVLLTSKDPTSSPVPLLSTASFTLSTQGTPVLLQLWLTQPPSTTQ